MSILVQQSAWDHSSSNTICFVQNCSQCTISASSRSSSSRRSIGLSHLSRSDECCSCSSHIWMELTSSSLFHISAWQCHGPWMSQLWNCTWNKLSPTPMGQPEKHWTCILQIAQSCAQSWDGSILAPILSICMCICRDLHQHQRAWWMSMDQF